MRIRTEWNFEDDELLKKYFSTKSLPDIASLLNRTYKSVLYRSKKLGLKKTPEDIGRLQSEKWENELGKQLDEPIGEWLSRRYNEGASYRELTAEAGINTRSLMRLMKKFNIEPITSRDALTRQIKRNPNFLRDTIWSSASQVKRAKSLAKLRQENWAEFSTSRELEFLDALNNVGLNPIPQLAIESFNIDFAFPDIMLAVELDPCWHNSKNKRRQDKKKDDMLNSLGWTVLRIDSRAKLCFRVNKVSEAIKSLASTHPR